MNLLSQRIKVVRQNWMNYRLRTARRKAGLTQAEVAAKFGHNKQWLSALELETLKLNYHVAQKLAAIYGVSLDYFLPSEE